MTIPTAKWRSLIQIVCEDNPPLPADVFEAMVDTESEGNEKARSKSDARGLAQVMYKWHGPAVEKMANTLGIKGGPDALYVPELNLRVAAAHLTWLYNADSPQKRSWERAIRKYHLGSYEPAPGQTDGQGTTSDAHITRYRKSLAKVRADLSGEEYPVAKKRDKPIVIGIGMGHRNTGRGGASGEFAWTPESARALQRRARARHMIAELFAENDGDTDPNFSNTDRQTAANRGAKAVAKKHGRIDVIVFKHYNGGQAAGAHFLYPDGWVSPVTAAENPGDVRLARGMASAVKATGTVSLLSWPKAGPGVMSERESGAVNNQKGARLGEFLGTDPWRKDTYRIIAEAGSIDVARERAYIRDSRWVEHTYCEALLNAIELELGVYRPDGSTPDPGPVDPTPQPNPTYATPIRIPEIDAFRERPPEASPVVIKTKQFGHMWLIDREVHTTDTAPRMNQPDEANPLRNGPDILEGSEPFYAWYGGISKTGRPFIYTLWASFIWLDLTDMGLPA